MAHLDVSPHLPALPRLVRALSADVHEPEWPVRGPPLTDARLLKCARGVHNARVRRRRVLLLRHPHRAPAQRPDTRIVLRELLSELGRVGVEVRVDDRRGFRRGVCRQHRPVGDGATREEGYMRYFWVINGPTVDREASCIISGVKS